MVTTTSLRLWRGTTLPSEIVDGRVYYLYDSPTSDRFTVYVDHDGVRSRITGDNKYKMVTLSKDGWTGTETEGGRTWVTQTLSVSAYYKEVLHAVPCGETVGDMATEEQEKYVSMLRAYLDIDTLEATFYLPEVPNVDINLGIEGII